MNELNLKISYLKNVLGLKHIMQASQDEFKDVVKTIPQITFLVSDNLSMEAKELLFKIASTFPKQPVKIIFINQNFSSDEVLKKLEEVPIQRILVFGEGIFRIIANSKSFYEFMNEPFIFFDYQVFSTHDLEDMVRGSNIDILKRQVWKQMKEISRKS
jgi:hypothetical protein